MTKSQSRWFLTVAALAITIECHAAKQPRGGKLKSGAEPPFTFIVIGDSRPGTRAVPTDRNSVSIDYMENILWINLQTDSEFSINVGDLIKGYNTAEPGRAKKQWDAFDKAGKAFTKPYFMVVGNHDVWDEYSDKLYQRRYGPHYFSFDHKQCHFTVISADIPGNNETIDAEQLKWLEDDLASAQDALHRFIFLHRPMWRNVGRYSKVREKWMTEVHPLLLKYKVDTVFAGHDHFYEYDEIDGIRCITTGGGGAELRASSKALGGFFHFLKVTVPKEGRPDIVVMEKNRQFPADVVRAGIQEQCAELTRAFALEPVVSGSEEPYKVSFNVTNPFDKELVLALAWDKNTDGTCPADPSGVGLMLQPGESREAAFSMDLGKAIGQPVLRRTLLLGGELLDRAKQVLPIARRGFYTSGPDRPSDSFLMRIDGPGQVVLGSDKWTGIDDCSAECWIRKVDDGLTISAHITDDVMHTASTSPWENDSLELYLDVRPDETRGQASYGTGVVQMIIVPDATNPAASQISFFPDKNKSAIPGATVETEILQNGYRFVVFLPAEGLKANHFLPGAQFHFSFGMNDADAATRESQLMWSGTSQNCTDTSVFGRMSPPEK